MTDGPTASAALLLPVGGLVLLLRDDCLDLASSQVGAAAAGRVRLVTGDRVRPGAGAADRSGDAYFLQRGDELRAVGGLSGGRDERERAAIAVGGDVDLAGLAAARAPEQGRFQSESVSSSPVASLLPTRIAAAGSSVLSLLIAPFDGAFPSSAATFSRALSTSSPSCIPAAS